MTLIAERARTASRDQRELDVVLAKMRAALVLRACGKPRILARRRAKFLCAQFLQRPNSFFWNVPRAKEERSKLSKSCLNFFLKYFAANFFALFFCPDYFVFFPLTPLPRGA